MEPKWVVNCLFNVTKSSLKQINVNCFFGLYYFYFYNNKELILHHEEKRY
jgi:hypothetical protein